jgi:hypothetical protein
MIDQTALIGETRSKTAPPIGFVRADFNSLGGPCREPQVRGRGRRFVACGVASFHHGPSSIEPL